MRCCKNWKLGDKLLFSLGAKQRRDFVEDSCLCVYPSSHPFYISLYSVLLFMQIVFFLSILTIYSLHLKFKVIVLLQYPGERYSVFHFRVVNVLILFVANAAHSPHTCLIDSKHKM